MLCFMTLVKYEASIKLLTTTPVYELLQSALTIGTCQKNTSDQQKKEPCLLSVVDDILHAHCMLTFLNRRHQCCVCTEDNTLFKISR